MQIAADGLFLSHTDPMWIYDLETLRFLAVNDAAVAKYGYSRDEFLAMTIADIRPPEDVAALTANVAATVGRNEAGVWRHRLKSGEVIHVDISGNTFTHDGRRAELISARDVSRFVAAEQMAHEALERETLARRSSDALARQFELLFESVSGMFVVFSPVSYDVIAVSDTYLAATASTRAEVVGRNLFDALPMQPDDATHEQLRASFQRVLASGEPDLMDVQCFVLSPTQTAPASEYRYWAISNAPVSGPDGTLRHLMLRVQDVTEAAEIRGVDPVAPGGPTGHSARLDLFAHTRELKYDNLRLMELAARLQTTQRLLDTGTWNYLFDEDRLVWSGNVYDMYGVTPDRFGHGFEDYVALVHENDRAAMRANFDAFMASGTTHFSFSHQVVHPNGRIVHVHGVAEKTETDAGAVLSGVVQNVTERVAAAHALARANRMLEIAGTSARFGAWRYDVLADRLEWSSQLARIHDEPDGFTPSIAEAFEYFPPEYRDKIAGIFQTCLDEGVPFNEILEIVSAKGRRLWVRTIGEAEKDGAGRIVAAHGSFQDISELMSERKRADESEMLLEIAGRAVRLGGWQVSLTDRTVHWTDGVAAIHDLPPGTNPSFEGGIDYFAPEERDSARQVFEACAKDGVPFDNVRDVITAKGRHIKVRSMGQPLRDASGTIVAVQGAMQDVTELTEARRTAEQMSQRLLSTFESIRDGFFTLDTDFRFLLVNSEAIRILAMEKDQLLGRVIWDVFPTLEASEFGKKYKSAVQTGETRRFVGYFADLDRWYDVAVFPSAEGLSVYFQDVTDLRREQEQLRLLDAAAARINDVVIITEVGSGAAPAHHKIVYVNDAFERLTGYTRAEAIGQTSYLMQGPRTQRAELDRIRQALARFEPVTAEVINYTKSGREYWVELDIVPIADAAGAFTHFVSVQRDVTERRRAEEALRVSETRFRLIAKATGNAVWDWDITGQQFWWSDEMAEIFGHEPDPASGPSEIWRDHLHADDARRIDAGLDRLVSGEVDALQERYRFRRGDGTWATVEDRAFAIRDAGGRTVRVLGRMTDITERLQFEDRLRQSQKLEAVGQLTGGVAHDFNNLLTIIMGNTEVLQDRLADDDPLRQNVDMSAMAADRAAELTNRLLAFSRKQPLQPRVVDVNEVITGVEGMLRRTLGEDVDIGIIDDQRPVGARGKPGTPASWKPALLNSRDQFARRDCPTGGRALTIRDGAKTGVAR